MERQKIALGILVACVLCLFVGIFTPQVNKTQAPSVVQSSFDFSEVDTSVNKVALLNLDGAISADVATSSWSNVFSLDNFLDSIKRVKDDNKVKAVVIRINSPGGTVAASQDIYDAVMKLREEKPVVVSMADMTASGGYYIASAADRIVAQRGTMTGSIGVIFNFMDVAGLADKLGFSSNVIKSGQFKDSGSMYRKMTADEKNLFQTSIDVAYKQFVADITKGRVERNDKYKPERNNLSKENLLKYADGRIFLGEEALAYGFVDYLGSQEYAVEVASKLAGYENSLPVYSYNKPSAWKTFLMGMEGLVPNQIKEVLPFSYTHSSRPLMILE